MQPEPYDPLDYGNLARSVVAALLDQPEALLPPRRSFAGAGVYAIYYRGELPWYAPLAAAARPVPIYVGKAMPAGARKGGPAAAGTQGTHLYDRLRQHAKSLQAAQNLRLEDFRARYLVVVPVWITLAERSLISHFRPVWNTVVDGFGNHDVGAGRTGGAKPAWDVLHPGREWAGRLKANESVEQILARVAAHLTPPAPLSLTYGVQERGENGAEDGSGDPSYREPRGEDSSGDLSHRLPIPDS